MNTKFLFAAVPALLIAAPAMAQDEAPAYRGGPRLEVRVGADDVVVKVGDDSEGKVGLAFGGELGYDIVTRSGFVIGAYAGIEGATTKDCTAIVGNDALCLEAKRNITAGVRAGAVVGKGLLYAKGGYTQGRLKISYENATTPALNDSDSGNLDGFHVGAGYEVDITRNTYAKIEYVYTNYDTSNDLGLDVDVQRHQGLIGFGFRF